MRTKRLMLTLFTLVLLLTATQAALAKELGRVVISGPGLKTPIEITDPEVANQFGPDRLDDFEAMITQPPENPGETYFTIDRGYIDETGTIFGYDHLRYYPNPETGQGVIQYIKFDGGKSSNEGRWFRTNPEGEKALLDILARHGVTFKAPEKVSVQAAAPAAEPQKQPAPQQAERLAEPPSAETSPPNLPLIAGGALLLVMAVAAGAALARARSQKTGG